MSVISELVWWAVPLCAQVFSNPEEHEEMWPFLVNQTMRERDRDGDGLVDFEEYVGDRGELVFFSWIKWPWWLATRKIKKKTP